MTAVRTIDFWFDYASAYSYPAAMRVEALAAQAGVALRWQPFLLGPIFADQGWSDTPFNLYPAKGRYMQRDLERLCAKYGLRHRQPSQSPRRSTLAARVACRHLAAAWLPAFSRAVFEASFADDRDIGKASVLADCLDRLGLAGHDLVAEAQAPEHRPLLRAQVERARGLGLFGAPDFVIDGEVFWGNDRLEDALEWARRS